ncbi:hypothetical protein DL96DRAFT_1554253 [Flagelloscypha sp. PMI_526]|nr:hypothetical protein DL96DRAFT_1554253 [Flagelloscypha sp. PMI_526]
MRALDLGVESIERLRCALSPKADLLSTISALKNMTWLEAPVQIVAALQKCAATLAPIQWQKSLNTLLIIYLGDNFNSESADYPTFDAALQSLDLTWLPGLRQLVIFDWMDDIETRNHIIGLLQKCPSAELIILVSDDYLTVDYGHRILPTDDKRLVYYLTSTRLNDRALEASWTSLRESAFYVLHRRLPYIYRDNPFDDWGEITYCKGMHIWQWARAAQKEGKNIRTRPMELVEE